MNVNLMLKKFRIPSSWCGTYGKITKIFQIIKNKLTL